MLTFTKCVGRLLNEPQMRKAATTKGNPNLSSCKLHFQLEQTSSSQQSFVGSLVS